jgi:hypothetical protein
MKFWAKSTVSKIFYALKAYQQLKAKKARIYSQVLDERERIIKQQTIHKILKVGQYWHQKRFMAETTWAEHLETVLKRKAFLRWLKNRPSRLPSLRSDPILDLI